MIPELSENSQTFEKSPKLRKKIPKMILRKIVNNLPKEVFGVKISKPKSFAQADDVFESSLDFEVPGLFEFSRESLESDFLRVRSIF